MIKRNIQTLIEKKLFKGKAIVITGARQVGKTTLVKSIAEKTKVKSTILNCDEPDIRDVLHRPNSSLLRQYFGNSKLVIIDEAQRIRNIGITAKLIVDMIPEVQLILTGSSAFDLGNKTNEPLTGRKYHFTLFPVSFAEMVEHSGFLEEKRLINHRLKYGYYPDIINNSGEEKDNLLELASSYLFKDIFSLGIIKKTDVLDRLVRALALQIGSQVSLNELSGLLGIDKNTVATYINLLEKAFVVFSLRSWSTNQRNELKKSRKIYFWDTGIRNALIKNFNPPELRSDIGNLWENFVIAERIKHLNNIGKKSNFYFWRTYQKQEVDFVEEWAGKLSAVEIKWKLNRRQRIKNVFLQNYPDANLKIVTGDNFFDFIMD